MGARCTVGLGAACLALLAGAAGAQPLLLQDRDYRCTVIARGDEFPRGFPLGAPTLDAWGHVAFAVRIDPDFSYEVRVGRGEVDGQGRPRSRPLARASTDPQLEDAFFGTFQFGPVIENSGRVVFQAFDRPTGGPVGNAIYRVRVDHEIGVRPRAVFENQVLDPTSDFLGFDSVSSPLPNAAGLVAFRAGTAAASNGLFRGPGPGALLVTEDAGGVFAMDGGLQPFLAWLEPTPLGGATLLVDGVLFEMAPDPSQEMFSGLSLGANAVPIAAYALTVFSPTQSWRLGVNTGLGFVPYVDSAVDPFEPFGVPYSTSVNAWAEVAFLSAPDGDGETLLAADGDAVWRVRCDDPGAFGNLPFLDYQLSPRAINADGQIAFLARTAAFAPGTNEFQTYILRADPLPGHGERPPSCSGLADGTPCDDGDPETLSACSAGVCAGDPIPRPSCASRRHPVRRRRAWHAGLLRRRGVRRRAGARAGGAGGGRGCAARARRAGILAAARLAPMTRFRGITTRRR